MSITYHSPIPTWVTKTRIQAATEDLAERMGIEPGCSLTELINELGGQVKYKEYKEASYDTESILVDGDGNFTIYLPTDTSLARDRFTIAHELGHYFLHYPLVKARHPEQPQMKATRFVNEAFDDLVRAEWEANWFAAALLMPKQAFCDAWEQWGRATDIIAIKFSVTDLAARTRAKALGLLK